MSQSIDDPIDDRDVLDVDVLDPLDSLDAAIAEATRKIESGRVYDPKAERVRIGWIRVLAYALNVRRQMVVDAELDALSERVEALEESRGER